MDLTGQRFGRLTAKKYLRGSKWFCQCNCGNMAEVSTGNLRSGRTKSCGCLRYERASEVNKGNQYAATRNGVKKHYPYLYKAWVNRRAWCYNPKSGNYPNYMARGIDICPQWKDDPEAWCEDILAEIGPKPPGLTLDRIDNDRGYYPDNIRWATWSEQMRNRRKFKRRKKRGSEV